MVKALSGFIWVLVLAGVFMITMAIVSSVFTPKKLMHTINTEYDKYNYLNALDVAKKYTEVSFEYSVYQACFNTLAKGFPDESGFKNSLKGETKKYFESYLRSDYVFLDQYSVELPRGYEINLMEEGGELFASANSASWLKAEFQRQFVNVEDNSVFEKSPDVGPIEAVCYTVYKKGEEERKEVESKIKSSVKTAVEGTFKYTYEGLPGEIYGTCSEIFLKNLPGNVLETEGSAVLVDMGKAIESKLKAEYPNNIISFLISVPKVIWESQPQSYMNEKSQNVDFCVFEYNTETKFSVEVRSDEEYPVWNGQKVAMEKFRYFFEGKIYMTLPVK